jgi:hypothetical protein
LDDEIIAVVAAKGKPMSSTWIIRDLEKGRPPGEISHPYVRHRCTELRKAGRLVLEGWGRKAAYRLP